MQASNEQRKIQHTFGNGEATEVAEGVGEQQQKNQTRHVQWAYRGRVPQALIDNQQHTIKRKR